MNWKEGKVGAGAREASRERGVKKREGRIDSLMECRLIFRH